MGSGPAGFPPVPRPRLSQDIVAHAANATARAIRKFGVRRRTQRFSVHDVTKMTIALIRMSAPRIVLSARRSHSAACAEDREPSAEQLIADNPEAGSRPRDMAILDRFRSSPANKHPDPEVRLAYVETLTIDDREPLASAAREDESARVRRAAVGKLMDPSILALVVRDDPDPGVRAQAMSMLRDIALEAFEETGEAESLAAIDAITDVKILSQVVKTVTRESSARHALARVTDPRALGSIARHAGLEPIRRAALDALQDHDEIVAVAMNGEFKDAAVDGGRAAHRPRRSRADRVAREQQERDEARADDPARARRAGCGGRRAPRRLPLPRRPARGRQSNASRSCSASRRSRQLTTRRPSRRRSRMRTLAGRRWMPPPIPSSRRGSRPPRRTCVPGSRTRARARAERARAEAEAARERDEQLAADRAAAEAAAAELARKEAERRSVRLLELVDRGRGRRRRRGSAVGETTRRARAARVEGPDRRTRPPTAIWPRDSPPRKRG